MWDNVLWFHQSDNGGPVNLNSQQHLPCFKMVP